VDDKTIFIVEDDRGLSDMLSAYFQELGYQVDATAAGEDALRRVADVNPDLILLDINLPGIDGYQVCRRIRESGRCQETPVIFMTERQEKSDRLSGLELGAVDYVTKPFDVQELGLRVRNTIARAGVRNPTNPVTGLPDERVTRAKLAELLKQANWGVILAGINGLSEFSDRYGFVAADDVARAAGVMLRQETDLAGDCEFLGHISPTDFVIITSPGRVKRLAEQCRQRLNSAIPYFYPATDWKRLQASATSSRLTAHIASATSADKPAATLNELRLALINAS
jgi:CheY-like chemotaxis protein